MTWTYIKRTEHAKLRLAVDDVLTIEEYEALEAALRAWRPAVVSEGTETTERLLEDLKRPPHEQILPCAAPASEEDNTETFRGPLDISVMGLRLHDGDVAVVTRSHREAHVGTMHRWIKHPAMEGDHYGCGHGGCNASVEVTR